MRANGDTLQITGEGLRPAQSGLSDKAPPEHQDPPRRGDPRRARRRRTPGRSPSCRKSKAPSSRSIRATARSRRMVGGFDFDKNKFNHVTQAWRQPGSSFKPFIYSAALEKGFTPATVDQRRARCSSTPAPTGGQPWEPKNYDGTFDGPMSHAPRARQVEEHGVDPHPAVDRHALRAGLDQQLRLRPREAPGLPADGAGRRLGHADADGDGLRGVRQRRLPRQPLPRDARHRPQGQGAGRDAAARCSTRRMRAIPQRNAFIMDSLLQERGAQRHRPPRRRQALKRADLYGKTGTTNDSLDAWFAGFQPTHGRRWPGSATTRRASWATRKPAAA